MSSSIEGVYLHVFSSDDNVDDITRQRVQLRQMLDIATIHLKDCHYHQAKVNFLEARAYLRNSKKRVEMNLPDELDFYINAVICYSYVMELDNIKDVTNEEFKREDNIMRGEIINLVKKHPRRHFPLFLRLLYAFKKECWREAIYFCELVQCFKVSPEEEKLYKSTPIFSKHLIPELDIDYCNEVVYNIEEATIYGLVEKLAKLDELKSPKSTLAGFKWVNLWSKEFNDKIIKRLRSYKKPMNSCQLHKLFHSEVLPKFYYLNKPAVGKSLFGYYSKEFMYQCEQCLRAKLQQESRRELFGRICDLSPDENYSDDTDCFDTDDDDDYSNANNGDSLALPPISLQKDKEDKRANSDSKYEPKEEPSKETAAKCITKKTVKSQQTQTDKIKINHRYVQTECNIKKKSIATQTDVPKTKKPEKVEKKEEVKCSKCTDDTKLLSALDEIKKQLSESTIEMKQSIQDQLDALLKQIKDDKININSQNERTVDRSFEIGQSVENVTKLGKRILVMQEKFDKENKEMSEKNVFLQKALMDQINDKYMFYKNMYSGLENNCRVIIANVAELQNFLTLTSVPNTKDIQSYLSRWEKTLVDLQTKNGQLKSFYKKAKSQMLHLSDYNFSDWPEIAEIPIEAFGFLFDSLKQSVKSLGLIEDQQKSQNQQIVNQPLQAPTQNQAVQMPVGQMYPVGVMPQNVRNYAGSALRYGTYQQPPPPIPMPPLKNHNPPFQPWSQHNNMNAQMYQTNTQWSNNPSMTAFLTSFSSNSDETIYQGSNSQNQSSTNQESQKNSQDNMGTNKIWNVDSINYYSNSSNETSGSQNQNANPVAVGNLQGNLNMNDYFSNFRNISASSSSKQGLSKSNQYNKAADEQRKENFGQNGYWTENSKDLGIVGKQAKDKNKNAAKLAKVDNKQVSNNQESGKAGESGASSISNSMENLSGKIIHRPLRPQSKLVNVCKEEDKLQFDADKELFQYLRTNCSDVDNDELISNMMKVLKKFNGSFNKVPKADILKEVRSSILSNKHRVWISPKTSIVDWENDRADSHCSICFDDLTQRPKCVLPCKHEYHKDCISQWLKTNSVCPICRVHSVIDEDYPPLS